MQFNLPLFKLEVSLLVDGFSYCCSFGISLNCSRFIEAVAHSGDIMESSDA